MLINKNSDTTLIITNSPLFVKQHLDPLINYEFLHSKVLVVTSFDRRYLISKNNYKFCPILIKRNPSVLDIIGIFQFIYLRIKHKPNQVISFTPKGGIYNFLTSRFGGKSFHYFTGQRWAMFTGIKRSIYKFIDFLLINFLDEVFSDSFSQSNFLADVLKTKKPKVINYGSISGVDISLYVKHKSIKLNKILSKEEYSYWKKFNSFIKEAQKNDALIFGFVGRLNNDKGIPILIKAFTKHLKTFPHSKLVLIGPIENNMESFSDSLISDSIIHINYVQKVFVFYPYFDVFVLPSYREGFGSSIIEAAASKVPSIATSIPGPVDFVEHMVNGYLIKKGSIKQLHEALNFFSKNPNKIKTYGLNSFKKVSARFDRDVLRDLFCKKFNIL